MPISQNGRSCPNVGSRPAVDSVLHRFADKDNVRRVISGSYHCLFLMMFGFAALGFAESGEIDQIQKTNSDGSKFYYEAGPGEPEHLVGILDPSISARPMCAWYTYNPSDHDGRTAQTVNLHAPVSAGEAVLSWFRGIVNGLANLTVANWLAPFGITRWGEFSGKGQDQYVSGKVFNFTGQSNGAQMITRTSAITDESGHVIGELTPQHIKLYYTFSFWGKVHDAVFGADVYGTTATGLYFAELGNRKPCRW